MAEGWVTVAVRKSLKQKLENLYESDVFRPRNQKFTAWLDGRLSKIAWIEEIELYRHFVKLMNLGADYIDLFDTKKNENVKVWINSEKQRLECEVDPTNPLCLHIGYCWQLEKVAKVLSNRGMRPPRA